MRRAAAHWFACVVAAALAAAGCRAQPVPPVEDMGVDMSVGGGDDLAGDDLAVVDLAMCPVGPEVCGNGCDDDRNGYADADDPACTSQMLVTLQTPGTPQLWRLVLEPQPHVVVLDGNPVTGGGMATLNGMFAPGTAFIAFDSSSKLLRKTPLGGTQSSLTTSFTTRDVCVFNGELIVVEPLNTSNLHRFMADGKTEIMPPVSLTGIAGACSSDGDYLYVTRHTTPLPSEIVVFGKSAAGPMATGTVIAMPDDLLNAGYDRIVDLAYVKKGGVFIGLFAKSAGMPDSSLQGEVMAPFGFDGGVGGYIDGGVWHGIGEFVP